ncbi:hypothetical protein ACE1SV_62800 [Streptomyces sennicomposti]
MLSGGPPERVLHAARVTVEALRHMCQGIMREPEIRGDLTRAVPSVLNVIHDKTAALTGAACQAGAILAGATPGQADPWLDRPGRAAGEREADVVAQVEGLAHPVVGVPEFTAAQVEQVQAVGGGRVACSCGVLPPSQGPCRPLREVEQETEVQGAVSAGRRRCHLVDHRLVRTPRARPWRQLPSRLRPGRVQRLSTVRHVTPCLRCPGSFQALVVSPLRPT